MNAGLAASELVITPAPAALGVAAAARSASWNAAAAIDAIETLAGRLEMASRLADLGLADGDLDQIATDALDDEVLANTPCPPTRGEIRALLAEAAGRASS
jgi:alcohol dehydrogenase class IV